MTGAQESCRGCYRYSTYLVSKWTWELLPAGQRLGENAPMAALVVFSWAFWLYPVYRMEMLREPKAEYASPSPAAGLDDQDKRLISGSVP